MRPDRFAFFLSAATLVATPVSRPRADEETGAGVRVAAISFVPVKFDLAGNADRLARAFRSASEGAAKIAVAPEGALDGYVVNEIIAGDADAERMRDVAIPIDDPVIQRFERLARELEMCLVFGFAERIGDDVFNCAVFIDHEGRIRGKYHKMLFAEGYDPSWWFNRLGNGSHAFDTPYGRCGLMICNDRWNPRLARIPVLDGARFLIIPAFGSRSKSQDEAVLSRGRENGIPVIEANVGVSLLVDGGEIVAVERREDGITFGRINIPPAIDARPELRDEAERKFLQWRDKEMRRRLERARQRRQRKRDHAVERLKSLGAKIGFDPEGRVIAVDLGETGADDADLVHLAALNHLRELDLHQTKSTGAGLAHLQGAVNLERLFLSDTPTDDAGLAPVRKMRNLKILGLSGTNVSDVGLAHLKGLRRLESLFLIDAKVTAEGVEQFKRSAPACEVTR